MVEILDDTNDTTCENDDGSENFVDDITNDHNEDFEVTDWWVVVCYQ